MAIVDLNSSSTNSIWEVLDSAIDGHYDDSCSRVYYSFDSTSHRARKDTVEFIAPHVK